jgi:hypothetical protein
MTLTPKKVARPPTKSPNEDPDPVGFGATLAEMIAALQDAYRARTHAFLRVFLLVRLAPAVLRSVLDAATRQGGPVSFDLRITVYPRNASGFFRVVGALKTPSADLWNEDQPEEQPDAPERGPFVTSIFGEKVPVSRLKTKRRRFGRRK